jgi:hypothetical protein
MRYDVGRFRRPMRRSTEGQLMSLISLGDGSTLSLDFTTGVLDSRLTFTRASTVATYINSSGLIATASTNVARFDHDPTTLAPKGLLIEGAATNLCLNGSMAYTATAPTSWVRGFSGCTVASVNSTTFSGEKAWSISATASGQRDLLEQVISLAANTTYTVSVYLESVTGTTATFAYMTSLPAGATSGTVVNPSSGRVSFTVTVGATAGSGTVRIGIGSATGTGVSADASVRFSHVQVEAGSGASSYIPTGASTVQRLADECQLLDLTTMGFNASAGTIYTDVGVRQNTGSQRNYTFLPASGGNNQIFEGSGIAFNVYSSGSFVAQIGTSLLSASKIAAGYAVNDYAVSINGAAVVTDTSGALPSSLTKLTIGGSIVNAAAYANGCIRTFKYWPTRLPNATLQSLTT